MGVPNITPLMSGQPKAIEDLAKITPGDPNARIRGFVNMKEPNLKKLIQVGQIIAFPDPSSPTGMKTPARTGDIWIQFINGYWTGGRSEGDTERISWCEAQGAMENCEVKDVQDPQAKVWAELVAGQTWGGRRDPTVSPSVDINSALRGEASLTQGGDDLDGVIATIAKANAGLDAAQETGPEAPAPEPVASMPEPTQPPAAPVQGDQQSEE